VFGYHALPCSQHPGAIVRIQRGQKFRRKGQHKGGLFNRSHWLVFVLVRMRQHTYIVLCLRSFVSRRRCSSRCVTVGHQIGWWVNVRVCTIVRRKSPYELFSTAPSSSSVRGADLYWETCGFVSGVDTSRNPPESVRIRPSTKSGNASQILPSRPQAKGRERRRGSVGVVLSSTVSTDHSAARSASSWQWAHGGRASSRGCVADT